MSIEDTSNSKQRSWDPNQYNKFAAEREQPFWDLAGMIRKVDNPTLADLGCGDGRLTLALHKALKAKSTIGIDFSDQMLRDSANFTSDDVRFEKSDIASWEPTSNFDIIFANASLQWVTDHRRVITRLTQSLTQRGQLAIQVPNNADHPVYLIASKLGEQWLGPSAPEDTVAKNVLKIENYAEILDQLGFERQNVRMQVYNHRLAHSLDTLEWVKGTSLNRFKAVMSEKDYDQFLREYKEILLRELGDKSPYLFTFKRILMWAQIA